METTKLHLRPGQKGRLMIAATVAVLTGTIKWVTSSGIVVLDRTKQKTPFDNLVVASSPGKAYVEFEVLKDAEGNEKLIHVFEIEVSDRLDDSKELLGSARISRESMDDVPSEAGYDLTQPTLAIPSTGDAEADAKSLEKFSQFDAAITAGNPRRLM